jgi:hypothetical protein
MPRSNCHDKQEPRDRFFPLIDGSLCSDILNLFKEQISTTNISIKNGKENEFLAQHQIIPKKELQELNYAKEKIFHECNIIYAVG